MHARISKKNLIRFPLVAALIGTMVVPAQAMPIARGMPAITVAIEIAKAPKGWVDFCRRHPADCKPDARRVDPAAQFGFTADDHALPICWQEFADRVWPEMNAAGHVQLALAAFVPAPAPATVRPIPRIPELTDDAFAELERINLTVNRKIKPVTDIVHYGKSEYWTYPNDGRGDCEDYALLKRKLLSEAGWPRESLLMTVVWAGREGHTVLMVRTDQGDFVLDNQSQKVLLWSKTRYDFVKRQSPSDPNVWVYIDGDRPTASVAGLL